MSKTVTVCGDAFKIPVRKHTAKLVVTSPPYLGQRLYGDDTLEIGREVNVQGFVICMVMVGRQIRESLTEDGAFVLNLGDKANGSGGAGGDYNAGGSKDGKPKYGKFYDPLFEKGQFLDIPGKVVAALQRDGWRLRQEIIWDKGQESRESLEHVRRPRTAHEKLFFLAPTKARSTWHADRLPETGSVWHFPPAQAEKKGHPAPFPDELARRCVLACTDPGDLVLDPFVGSGTTTRIATSLGRRAVGIDLYAGRNP